jgi:hypothetical protein
MELAYDLRSLRGSTVANTFIDRQVNFTGLESRVYKYAVSKLAPNACQAITALALKSQDPSANLTMRGTCLEAGDVPAGVKVIWSGREANLFIEGFERSGRLTVLMYPPESRPAPPAVPAGAPSAEE